MVHLKLGGGQSQQDQSYLFFYKTNFLTFNYTFYELPITLIECIEDLAKLIRSKLCLLHHVSWIYSKLGILC